MNVKRTVLCYGDSNTFGVKSDRSGRYEESERWPGILQELLGDEYDVAEDGLPGRTTDLDHPNPNKPGRNGWETFPESLRSHAPLDILIIMLGTNDLKVVYDRSPEEVAAALARYVEFTRDYCSEHQPNAPVIILVSPPWMDDEAPEFESSMPMPGVYDHDSVVKSQQLAGEIKATADKLGCKFFDAASVAKTGIDGCHMDSKSHQALAAALKNIYF